MIQQTNINVDSAIYVDVLKSEIINLTIENMELKILVEHFKEKLKNIEIEKLKEAEND